MSMPKITLSTDKEIQMRKMLLSVLAILSLNFALLSLPSSAYNHSVIEREVRFAARNPTAYRRYNTRRTVHRHHHNYYRRPTTRTVTTVHHH
ncbi:hypothetical protein BH10CYA1_BH10CYA1_26690 [soil metagenome]